MLSPVTKRCRESRHREQHASATRIATDAVWPRCRYPTPTKLNQYPCQSRILRRKLDGCITRSVHSPCSNLTGEELTKSARKLERHNA